MYKQYDHTSESEYYEEMNTSYGNTTVSSMKRTVNSLLDTLLDTIHIKQEEYLR